MLLIIGVALCFTFAYVSELIGLTGIIGAFAAGVFLDPSGWEFVRKRKKQHFASFCILSQIYWSRFFSSLFGYRLTWKASRRLPRWLWEVF